MKESTSGLDAMFAGNFPMARLQASYFERASAFRLQIEVTSACSADCSYCYAKRSSKGEPLTVRELKELLRRAASLGIKQVDWMGGDPLEHPDWIQLLQAARYNGMTNNLWTSGSRLNDVGTAKWVVDLTEGGYVMVHLDSLDPEVLRSIRSTYNPAMMSDALRGVELLQDIGKPPSEIGNLLMLTSLQGLEDIKETMTVLYEDYGMRTCLMSLKPVDGSGEMRSLIPSPDTVSAAYRFRDSLFLPGRTMGCQDFPREYCGTTVFISLDGVVSSCYSLRRELGSVRERDLGDIILEESSSLFFDEFRKSTGQMVCRSCDKRVCWGCRANAFYFGEGSDSRDPLCNGDPNPIGMDLPH